MIKIYIGGNIDHVEKIVPPDKTPLELLQAENLAPENYMFNGSPLTVEDYSKPVSDLAKGSEVCFLVKVAKADNARSV